MFTKNMKINTNPINKVKNLFDLGKKENLKRLKPVHTILIVKLNCIPGQDSKICLNQTISATQLKRLGFV